MLDYIHSAETEQFSFLRVPKILLQNDTFKGISAEAKLLYSILFAGLSFRTGTVGGMIRIASISSSPSRRSRRA